MQAAGEVRDNYKGSDIKFTQDFSNELNRQRLKLVHGGLFLHRHGATAIKRLVHSYDEARGKLYVIQQSFADKYGDKYDIV